MGQATKNALALATEQLELDYKDALAHAKDMSDSLLVRSIEEIHEADLAIGQIFGAGISNLALNICKWYNEKGWISWRQRWVLRKTYAECIT